jgi:hypothetical protein
LAFIILRLSLWTACWKRGADVINTIFGHIFTLFRGKMVFISRAISCPGAAAWSSGIASAYRRGHGVMGDEIESRQGIEW